MQPLAIDLRLLSQLRGAELRLSAGRALMARVMVPADATGRGKLNIAGEVVNAELPRELRAGDQVRLVVRSLEGQRVVLELARDSDAIGPAPPGSVGLPGGASVRVNPDEEPDSSPGRRPPDSRTLSLRYETPALGALDLRFELGAGALQVTVAAPAGEALALARQRCDDLQSALARHSDRRVQVTVRARREPLDVYA